MKKYVLGLIAIVFALGTSAFTATRTNNKVSKTAQVWEYRPGPGQTTADAAAYVKVGVVDPEFECGGEGILCKITADEDPMNNTIPLLSHGDPGDVNNSDYLQESRTP